MSVVLGWGVILGNGVNPTYYYWEETPDRAVEKARAEAAARHLECWVVKLVQTHVIKPPVCRCEPEVVDVAG